MSPLIIPVLVAVGGLCLFGSGGGDDSHITWWSVDELRRTGRILNFNGAALEQSSSLALVLIVAALKLVVPVSTPALGVVLSVIATSATCWMTWRLAQRIDPGLAAPAALLVGTSGPLVYWGTSGMETGLAAFASVWLLEAIASCLEMAAPAAAAAAKEKRRATACLLGAAILFITVRPENPLLLLALMGGSATFYAISLRTNRATTPQTDGLDYENLLSNAVVAAAPIPILFGLRQRLFHEWFPHPVAAKAGDGARWGAGWKYLTQHMMAFQPALLLLLPLAVGLTVVLSLSRRVRPFFIVLVVHATLGVAFICASGGDWMSCGRFLAPQLPTWWLAVLACASALLQKRTNWLTLAAVAVSAANLFFLVGLTRGGGTNGYPLRAARKVVPQAREQYHLEGYSFLELSNKSHMRDALVAEELKRLLAQIATVVPGKIWIASGQAGGVPYHVFSVFPGKLRFIDFWGITTSEVMPCLPPAKLRHSSLGVSMSPELIFQYQDTISRDCGVPPADIVFNTSLRAGTKRGLEARGYQVVYFQRGAMPSFSEPSTFRGGTSIDAYIAVRRELAEQLQLRYREVRWSIAG